MAEVSAQKVWDALRGDIGEDLRVVIRYSEFDLEAIKRDDIREQSTPLNTQEIVDGIIIRHLNFADDAERFHVGSLSAIVRVFESAHVISRPDSLDKKTGFIISIDRGEDVTPSVEQTVELLEDAVQSKSN